MAIQKTSAAPASVHDGYALRLHLQIVNMTESPSVGALSQLSLLLSVLATGHDNDKFRPIKKRTDSYSMAINAAVNVANRIAKRSEATGNYWPTREEAMVLRACAAPLDRLFGRIPAAKLQAAEFAIRMKCGWPMDLHANDLVRTAA